MNNYKKLNKEEYLYKKLVENIIKLTKILLMNKKEWLELLKDKKLNKRNNWNHHKYKVLFLSWLLIHYIKIKLLNNLWNDHFL